MIKNNLKILIIILFSTLLYSCQSAKEALEGKKRSDQSDEFLVQKKNPLAMPPDYEKLPTPGNQESSAETFVDNDDVKDLLSIEKDDSETENTNDPADIESSILDKIK